jgi:hypothetical protein
VSRRQILELAVWLAGCFFAYHAVLSLFGIGIALSYAESGSELTPSMPLLIAGYALPPLLFAVGGVTLLIYRKPVAIALLVDSAPDDPVVAETYGHLCIQVLGLFIFVRAVALLSQLGIVFAEETRHARQVIYIGLATGILPDVILFCAAWCCIFRNHVVGRRVFCFRGETRDIADIAELTLATVGVYMVFAILPNVVSTVIQVAWATSGTDNTVADSLMAHNLRLLLEAIGESVQVLGGMLLFMGRTRLVTLWRKVRPMAA